MLVLVLSNVAMSLLARDGGDGADGAGGAGGTADAPGGEAPGPSTAPAVLLRALVITSILTAAFESLLLVRAPSASASLGIYAPLIAVNCLVLGLGAPGASRSGPGASAVAALGRGLAFALALVLIALVRETLGAGTITLFPMGAFGGTIEIRGLVDQPVRALGLAGGGLLGLGYLAGAARAVAARAAARSAARAAAQAAARNARGEST